MTDVPVGDKTVSNQTWHITKEIGSWSPAFGLTIVLVGLWELLAHMLDVQPWLLPAPSEIARELGESFSLHMEHAWITLQEIFIGFLLAALLGAVLASAISWSRIIERSLYPIVIASQTIPIITLAPLLLVWVGPEMTSKVIVVVLISFFPIVVSLVDGLRSADTEMADMMRTLGASRMQLLLKLRLPAALPYLFSGLKVAAVTAVIGAVVGEWVGGRGGLGWLMKVSGPQFRTDRVFAAIFVLSVVAVLMFLLVVAIERYALRNHGPRGSNRMKSL
jgi:ABC-type nitrate/sulfonate/bicarbonate transport system permease component